MKKVYFDPIYLRDLSDKELAAHIERIIKEMFDIESKLNLAKAEFHATKKYSDPVWFAKIKNAKAYKGFQHQQLLAEQGRRTKERKQREQQTIENRFIKIAKVRLDEYLFNSIMEEAREVLL